MQRMFKKYRANKKLSEIKKQFQDGSSIYICDNNGTRTKIEQMTELEEKAILDILLDGSRGKSIVSEWSEKTQQIFLHDNMPTPLWKLFLIGAGVTSLVVVAVSNIEFVRKLKIRYVELTQEYLDKNDFCFVGGKKVNISDTETAQLYGQDLYVLPFGGVVTDAFCIGKQRTTNIAIFVVQGKTPIVERVTLETIGGGSVKLIRPNGFNVVGIK